MLVHLRLYSESMKFRLPLFNQALMYIYSIYRFRIGLRWLSRSSMTWATGTPVSYTYWQRGKPATDNRCAATDRLNVFQWMDYICHYTYSYVCERKC